MVNEIIQDTEYVVLGITDIAYKAVKGIVLSFFLLILSRFLDVVFGISWISNEQIIYLVIFGFSFYHSFISYKKFKAYYISGWVIGIYTMVFLDFIPSSKALIYVLIPIIVLTIRKILFHN